jgi:hypothetical protein
MVVAAYTWLVANRGAVGVIAVAVPVAGTLLAWAGKAGRTEADSRRIASAMVAAGMLAVAIEVAALALARGAFGRGLLDADVVLLAAPPLCLAGCLVGARALFPLGGLGSVRAAVDLAAFAAACIAVVWLFSTFRGWGILFFGSLAELVAIAALALVLVRRLARRALGPRKR